MDRAGWGWHWLHHSHAGPREPLALPGVPGQEIDSSGGRFGACRWWVLCPPHRAWRSTTATAKGLSGPFPGFVGSEILSPGNPPLFLPFQAQSMGWESQLLTLSLMCPQCPIPPRKQMMEEVAPGDTYMEGVPEQRQPGWQGRRQRGQRETRYIHRQLETHGRAGIRACTTCGAPEDTALHWGITPHTSPLSCSSPVCTPMVPTWL